MARRLSKRAVVEIPARKPMASARRLSLFQRTVETRLSSSGVELLLEGSSVLSEGGFDGERYAGSTMVTIDLAASAHKFSDPPDAATARRFAELVPTDPRARGRARALATQQANAEASCHLIEPVIDVRARAQGTRVHLDLDIEANRSAS